MDHWREMLSHLADELNVKRVEYAADGGTYVLEYDTVRREATSIEFKEDTN